MHSGNDDGRTTAFVGRSIEAGRVARLVRQVEEGSSAVLTVSGPPGVGKSRLLVHALADVNSGRVLRIDGYEAEARFAFAALQRLTDLLPAEVGLLSPDVRAAMQIAFGKAVGPTPSTLVIGMATLAVLNSAGAERPLFCTVDDAHWIDGESLEALGFAARRLDAARVGLVFAIRDIQTFPLPLTGLPRLTLGPLGESDLRLLIANRSPSWVSPHVVGRLITESDGSPLALLEHLSLLSHDQLSGASPMPAALPVGEQLAADFRAQYIRLPKASRDLLLLLSAAGPDDAETLEVAMEGMGLSPNDAEPAMPTLLVWGAHGWTFRHPLIRSVFYENASVAERRAAHIALADAAAAAGRIDVAASHRGYAIDGADESVAAELEAVAVQARARGGVGAEAEFLAMAVSHSIPGSPAWQRRTLDAANALIMAGDAVSAEALLADWSPPGVTGALVTALRVRAERAGNRAVKSGWESARLLSAATQAEAESDDHVSAEIRRDALSVALEMRHRMRGTTLREVAAALRDQPIPHGEDSDVMAVAYKALADRCSSGHAAAAPSMQQALRRITASLADASGAPSRWDSFMIWMIMEDLWDDRFASTSWSVLADIHRTSGSLAQAWYGLGSAAITASRHGDSRAADDLFEEADVFGDAFGNPRDALWAVRIEVEAWRGHEDEVRTCAERFLRVWTDEENHGSMATYAHYALTTLDLALTRYADALVHARWVAEDDAPGHGSRILPDLVEAATRVGEHGEAQRALSELAARTRSAGTPWALGVLERSRAIVSGSAPDAELHFERALEVLASTPLRTEQARTHLVYGEWLRRQRRRGAAAKHLSEAVAEFDAMGAALFRERASRELSAARPASGSEARSTRSPEVLTPQEQRVNDLAAHGLTNREISERLFLSTSTVDYHLAKVFRKRGVSSRRQLRD